MQEVSATITGPTSNSGMGRLSSDESEGDHTVRDLETGSVEEEHERLQTNLLVTTMPLLIVTVVRRSLFTSGVGS